MNTFHAYMGSSAIPFEGVRKPQPLRTSGRSAPSALVSLLWHSACASSLDLLRRHAYRDHVLPICAAVGVLRHSKIAESLF